MRGGLLVDDRDQINVGGVPMARRIILLSDGTGNAASRVWRTNVWRVFESLDLTGSEQVAIYDDGVGTSSFKPLAILGGAFGWGLKRNVLDLYRFVCRNHRSDDDEIFAFGFSRGAFTIRVVMGLICSQGLVRYETEAELYKKAKDAYRAFRRENYHTIARLEEIPRSIRDLFSSYDKSKNRPVNKIRFLGLWDTVAAYGLPVDEMTRGVSQWLFPLELPERRLGDKVQRACHALALDDERTTFHPVLWNERGEKPAPPDEKGVRHTKDERISQVWFAGVHSNVGGGYPDDSLAHIPLNWIMSEAQACGLVYKTRPAADPDALTHVQGARDKDGRLYDPRKGLGSYYRYGPRKISNLCHMRFSRHPDDEVEIAVPKIHESALKRIRYGAHIYAPIGFPADYEVVTEDGRILSPAQNDFETAQQAQARVKAQEQVWNLVWARRVVYFATVAATLYLVLYPLSRALPPTAELSTKLRPVSDLVQMIGAFLPNALDVWVNAYARDPGKFLISVGVVAILTWWGSVHLTGKITDTMRAIWRSNLASGHDSVADRLIFGLRTSRPYQWLLSAFKWKILPALFAAAFLYLGVAFASHLIFDFEDSAGWICKEGPSPPRRLARGETSPEITFATKDICTGTGIELERGGNYSIVVRPHTPWRDNSIDTSTQGFYASDLPWHQHAVMLAAWPLKRSYIRPWFRVIARVGPTGNYENFLDPDQPPAPGNILQETFRPQRSGELFFYVNDAVLALRGLQDAFYRNNSGDAVVTIMRR
jgi:uncharacterized protein (DUF2235 family)